MLIDYHRMEVLNTCLCHLIGFISFTSLGPGLPLMCANIRLCEPSGPDTFAHVGSTSLSTFSMRIQEKDTQDLHAFRSPVFTWRFKHLQVAIHPVCLGTILTCVSLPSPYNHTPCNTKTPFLLHASSFYFDLYRIQNARIEIFHGDEMMDSTKFGPLIARLSLER